MHKIISVTFCLTYIVIVMGCNSKPDTNQFNTSYLVGVWELDEITIDWLDRACVVLDFPNNEKPRFEFIKNNQELILRFNNEAHTSWRSNIHRRVFDSTQILPTTASGRFCGDQTKVRVFIRFNPENQNEIQGTWQTPECNLCPDRVFDAIRVKKDYLDG